jgi:hypothetical protein
MMQATDFGNLYDLAPVRRLDGPSIRRILLERKVSSCAVEVREVTGQDAAQVPFAKDEDTIQPHSGRIEPMSRSAKGFCHGRWGVSTSRIPMPFTRCRNV